MALRPLYGFRRPAKSEPCISLQSRVRDWNTNSVPEFILQLSPAVQRVQLTMRVGCGLEDVCRESMCVSSDGYESVGQT